MRVFIDKSVCNKCHACIRVCSVGAVYYKNDRVYLNQEDCILCGKCMRVCKSNAIRVRCHAGRLEQLLSDRAVAVLDPVFCAAFDCKPGQLIAALREIGFAHVLEMTVGIEIYLNEWRKYMSEKGCEHPIISSYCPAVVSLVEKHFGNLSSFLLPVKSPMELSSQFAKRLFPSSKVMFIGPCVARKTELKNGSYTDMVITFEELAKLFCKKKLNLKELPESSFDVNFQHSAESCFSIDSLVKSLNFKTHDEINVLEVHHSDRCKEVLQALESKSLKVKALSLLFCDLGCLNGHQQMYKENYYIKKQRYIDYINKWKKEDKFMNDSILHYEDLNLDDFDTKRSFEVYKPVVKNYSKREVWKVLNKLGKYREKHLLDCGACGYKSCWEHAVSILENKAKASMCLPFLINEYRKSLNLATLFVVSKNLQEQAITDSVTGLYNHRFFQEKLGEEIISAQERGYSFAVLFIDIDHFKKINDMYRHLAGDELLVEFSEFLTEFLEDAFLARYGGDEFVAIVSDITPYKALELGASLVNKVRKKAFRIESNRLDLNLTISVGISCYPESATDKESLISFADQALYSAKEVRNTAVLYSSDLDDLVFGRTSTRENSVNFVRILNILLNLKDNYTYQHSYRVMRYAEILARKLYFSQTDIKYLKYGAYLHDIGKINISTSILTKPGKLSSEEYEIIKQHPDLGFEIVRKIDPLANEITMSAVLYHHERYDGKGYPRGLKGKEIPIWGRIMAIADSFDAMTTDRPYKKGMRYEEAIEEIKKNAGTQFDPELAWVFGDVVKKLYKEKEFFSSNNLRKLDINGILFRKLQN